MRLLTAFILGTVFAASPAYPAPIPKEEKKSNAELLVGKWELTGGTNEAPKDLTLIVEFSRGGKMTLTLEPKGGGGDKTTLTGKYKVEKDKIDYELAAGRQALEQMLEDSDAEEIMSRSLLERAGLERSRREEDDEDRPRNFNPGDFLLDDDK